MKKIFKIKYYTLKIILIFFLTFFTFSSILPQPEKVKDAAALKLALEKLNVLGTVLYLAAHPDDENTSLLSYFSSGKLLRTGYLAMTRGDGGQNLIGSEQGDELGVVRTQELLSARKIDGAEQFFTRAIDFGYSKSPEETMNIWGKEKILSDIVWVIRKFKPDVIITRFPGNGAGGHGHHTASEILAEQAFDLAGDSTKFPAQLKYVKTWQPKRLYWNAWDISDAKNTGIKTNVLSLDLGSYNSLLGKSYTEISAQSRSMHKSQGFGISARRGESINRFTFIKGIPAKENLFEDIDLTWNKIPGGEKVGELLTKANKEFDINDPSKIIPVLVDAYSEMSKLKDNHWIPIKQKELLEVIRSAAGIWIEAIASDFSVVPGESLEITSGIVNRSDFPFTLKKINLTYQDSESTINKKLEKENFETFDKKIIIPSGTKITQPYWLENPHSKGIYKVEDQQLIGKAENDPPLLASFVLNLNGIDLTFSTPVLFRWTDPVKGEKYRPIEITPPITINIEKPVYIFSDGNSKKIKILLKNYSEKSIDGTLNLNVSSKWKIEPEKINFSFQNKNEEKLFTFTVTPPDEESEIKLIAEAEINNNIYSKGIETIDYSHIPIQTLFPDAKAELLRLNINKVVNNIGYIMGSGDNIPFYLEQLGYKITFLSDDDLENNNLSDFDAIIAGIRAYNTRGRLAVYQEKLMNYVKNGGTYVVQYTVSRNTITDKIGPYPFELSRERVTVEESPVKFLKPDHQLLNYPNKITEEDFNDWIQERGLYFADKWDPQYETVISCHDPGESPLEGGLLFAHYGKGIFIYTGYSWFRQLPAGIPGSYKLFVNLISAGKFNDRPEQSAK